MQSCNSRRVACTPVFVAVRTVLGRRHLAPAHTSMLTLCFVPWLLMVSHVQDLSGGNVLLTSSSVNPHGFTARVIDFGLARNLDLKARTAPGRYGTITAMVRARVCIFGCVMCGHVCVSLFAPAWCGCLALLVMVCMHVVNATL